LEAVNGAGVTIAGVLSLQPEVAIPGFLVMVNGVATAYDGVSAIQTAQDGKGRESTYTEAAGDCCGIWRECTGELLSFGFTLSSCLQATQELLQRVATDKDAMKVVKDVWGGSGCNCR
jgi:hypothetical protein